MKVLLFEWLSGGGLWIDDRQPDPCCPFQRQGREMLVGLAADLLDCGATLVMPLDIRFLGQFPVLNRLSNHPDVTLAPIARDAPLADTLNGLANDSDVVHLIAPETGGTLLTCCNWLDGQAAKFCSPDRSFVRLASDKHATCQHLSERGVNVPQGCLLSELRSPIQFEFPVVIKPCDGAGSDGVFLIRDSNELLWQLENDTNKRTARWRLEQLIRGQPVSASLICNGDSFRVLTPTRQIFDSKPFGEFLCAEPLDGEILSNRARMLAAAAISALPPTRGYVGIDMVLGEAGADSDFVIEVNPRLTASYGLLRKLETTNLAEEILNCVD